MESGNCGKLETKSLQQWDKMKLIDYATWLCSTVKLKLAGIRC